MLNWNSLPICIPCLSTWTNSPKLLGVGASTMQERSSHSWNLRMLLILCGHRWVVSTHTVLLCKLLSHVLLCVTPWTVAHQAPLSLGFFQVRISFIVFSYSLIWSTEEAMAPHSSTLAWKIPWMEEPVRLQSMGSLRVRHDFTFTFTFHFHALEKEMATHSSVLAWRIPGMGEPGGLPSMGSQSRTRLKWLSIIWSKYYSHNFRLIR